MKHNYKRILSLVLAMIMLLGMVSMLAGCNGGGGNGEVDKFTIWMGSSVDSSYYTNYNDNPVIQYLEKKFEIDLEFIAPVAGNETDNFNTLIATGDYPDMMDLSFYTGTIADLYDNGDGICLDLTQYIADYMPYYSAFLEANKTGATRHCTW